MSMRPPTSAELCSLIKCIAIRSGDMHQTLNLIPKAHIGVIEKYSKSQMSFTGQVAIVMYAASPDLHEVYAWNTDSSEWQYCTPRITS